ncbi:MAG: hypothetical protein J2P20_04645, partial [Pseudonocardia sp.]|nr:hypothetical protein [Pseudonocardia sp.]
MAEPRASFEVDAGGRGAARPGNPATRWIWRIGGPQSWLAMLWLWLIYAMNANMRNWIQVVQPA